MESLPPSSVRLDDTSSIEKSVTSVLNDLKQTIQDQDEEESHTHQDDASNKSTLNGPNNVVSIQNESFTAQKAQQQEQPQQLNIQPDQPKSESISNTMKNINQQYDECNKLIADSQTQLDSSPPPLPANTTPIKESDQKIDELLFDDNK